MRKRYYVGLGGSKPTLLHLESDPTRGTHGHLYAAVIGPFQTKRGAEFMRDYGQGNPHIYHVRDAERLAKETPCYTES